MTEFHALADVLLVWFVLSCVAAIIWTGVSMHAAGRRRRRERELHIASCDLCSRRAR